MPKEPSLSEQITTEIRAAIDEIEKADPSLAAHLRQYIVHDEVNDTWSYQPPPGTPKWITR